MPTEDIRKGLWFAAAEERFSRHKNMIISIRHQNLIISINYFKCFKFGHQSTTSFTVIRRVKTNIDTKTINITDVKIRTENIYL